MLALFSNFDLLSVGVAIAATVVLGFVVFISNPKSATSRFFLAFSLVTAFWGLVNYLHYQFINEYLALWSLRLVFFSALWQAYTIFRFIYVFPKHNTKTSTTQRVMFYGVFAASLITLTPITIVEVTGFSDIGVPLNAKGPGMLIFAITAVGHIIASFYYLTRKIMKANTAERRAVRLLAFGVISMFALIIPLNFILPAVFEEFRFLPLSAVFTFPFVVFSSYAILKEKLFNIKIAGASVLVFSLSVVTFAEVLIATEIATIVYRAVVFLLVLLFGTLLLRAVLREVKQREQIEELATNLEKANARLKELDRLKSEFVSIASHQLRSPLTAIKGYASLILEGSFGKVNDSVKEAVQKMFDSSNLMAVSVQDFLDVSRIEQGKMKYNFEDFDLEKLLRTVVEEQMSVAKRKGLSLSLKITEGQPFFLNGDLGKIKQVLTNLIDNSIKYTPDGSVDVLMRHVDGNKVRIEIHDTGVGIAPETLPKLFDKFVRSRNAHHVNVSGTGLGLFVVKQMVEAHKGRVWATSEGQGRGSVFHIELG